MLELKKKKMKIDFEFFGGCAIPLRIYNTTPRQAPANARLSRSAKCGGGQTLPLMMLETFYEEDSLGSWFPFEGHMVKI